MDDNEWNADKARRIAAEVVRAADEVSALVASRPIDAMMAVQVIGIAVHHDATVQGILMSPPPKPGEIVREVRRFDLQQVNRDGYPRGPVSVAIRRRGKL